jgi:hypothetical protein
MYCEEKDISTGTTPHPFFKTSTSDIYRRQPTQYFLPHTSRINSKHPSKTKTPSKMRLTTTLATTFLSTLLTTTNAAPQTVVNPGGITNWSVTNFEIGCSPGGCVYNFNISGPASADVGPAFATYCSGTDVQQKIVPCVNQNVQANLVPTQDVGLVLVVNRYGGGTDGNNGLMSGNATAAPSGEPAYPSFVIPAKFYGDIVNGGN